MKKTIHIEKDLNVENIKRSVNVLIDNGIEEDEVGYVLQAIGYTLLDVELEELIRICFQEEKNEKNK